MLSITKLVRGLFARSATPLRPRPTRRPVRLEWLEERTLLCNPGELDLTFGTGGTVIGPAGSNTPFSTGAADVLVQPDGKILSVGTTLSSGGGADSTLVRYNADGSLDTSFGTGGQVVLDMSCFDSKIGICGGGDQFTGVTLQSNGKIIATGWASTRRNAWNQSDITVARFNTNGTLDTTFAGKGVAFVDAGTSGKSATDDAANDIALQADGKIVVAGTSRLFKTMPDPGTERIVFARLTSSGTLDTAFGSRGIVTTAVGTNAGANAVAIQPSNGKIVVAGRTRINPSDTDKFLLARYNTNGSLDSSFGGTGTVITDFANGTEEAHDLVIQPSDGKIVAVGHVISGTSPSGAATGAVALARYSPNGALDAGFGTGGLVTTTINGFDSAANGVALQADGSIVVAGFADDGYDFVDQGGQLRHHFNSDFAVARYTTSGSLDTSFNTTGFATIDLAPANGESAQAVAIQPSDGKIVVAGVQAGFVGMGTEQFALARYCS